VSPFASREAGANDGHPWRARSDVENDQRGHAYDLGTFSESWPLETVLKQDEDEFVLRVGSDLNSEKLSCSRR